MRSQNIPLRSIVACVAPIAFAVAAGCAATHSSEDSTQGSAAVICMIDADFFNQPISPGCQKVLGDGCNAGEQSDCNLLQEKTGTASASSTSGAGGSANASSTSGNGGASSGNGGATTGNGGSTTGNGGSDNGNGGNGNGNGGASNGGSDSGNGGSDSGNGGSSGYQDSSYQDSSYQDSSYQDSSYQDSSYQDSGSQDSGGAQDFARPPKNLRHARQGGAYKHLARSAR